MLRPRAQCSLLVLMLWVALTMGLLRNLQIVINHQEDIKAIWENILR